VGTYWHMLPTLRQGKLVVWDGITKEGDKVLDAWPEELITDRHNVEMKITLINGSMWQVVGSDNYNTLVGSNPIGVVFSEYALADPAAWDFIRPILAENGGWAMFPYTPRGRNHGYTLWKMAQDQEDWFCETLDVEKTNAITGEVVEGERRAGMSKELVAQEFFCSWDAPLTGSYYGDQMDDALNEKRIGGVPFDRAVQVETWWDLGIGDSTAIWFAQRVAKEVHLIDYYEQSGEPLRHYVNILEQKSKGQDGYKYSRHIFPHDVRARELLAGRSREEVLKEMGIRPQICPDHRVEDGIESVRSILPKCWFDKEKCDRGIEAMRSYRKERDDKAGLGQGEIIYKLKPLHNWASHAADSFRYGCVTEPKRKGLSGPLKYPNLRYA